MKLRQWVPVWVCMWMAGLGTIETAPRRDGIEASIPGANSRLFVDRPDFFDYPDSDQASLAAVAQFIGEKPVTFVRTGASRKGPKEPDRSPGPCCVPHVYHVFC
nr:fertilization-influencing membrane protein isoform X3 [Peromyscus maniculatus bairdii]